MDIAGKVFIVTGGASGLGEGTARALVARGGKVVLADMQADKGEAIAREIGAAFVRCDVANEADGQAVVAKAVSMGKLMGLVNCAGIAPAGNGTIDTPCRPHRPNGPQAGSRTSTPEDSRRDLILPSSVVVISTSRPPLRVA